MLGCTRHFVDLRLWHSAFLVLLYVAGSGCFLFLSPAYGQRLSPGPLSKPHQHLEGLSGCLQCHGDGQSVNPNKCQSCHGLIERNIKRRKGYHGRLGSQARCEQCHREHLGANRIPIDWGPEGRQRFDHRKTGFILRDAHLKTDCERCHSPAHIKDSEVLRYLKQHGRKSTFLGLSRECQSCHGDQHRGQLSSRCDSCHREKSWKPALGFVHNRDAAFKLHGKHLDVPCGGCHRAQEENKVSSEHQGLSVKSLYLKFVGLQYRSCGSCHQDPHQGQNGTQCQQCHQTSGWEHLKIKKGGGVRASLPKQGVDVVDPKGSKGDSSRAFHDAYRFSLRGEHVDVPCMSCHRPNPAKKPVYRGLPFKNCRSCHHDAHFGQVTARRPCEQCHEVTGFNRPLFGVEEHAATKFVLDGAHAAVSCYGCHIEKPQAWRWVPSGLKRLRKRQGREVLISKRQFKFKNLRSEKCQSCHEDIHGGQFFSRQPRKPCVLCHQTESFSKLAQFNHDEDTKYTLQGAHRRVDCQSCHRTEENQPTRYRGLKQTCQSCHEDIHLGQFQKKQCVECHQETRFSQLKFDHQNKNHSSFALEGKHQRLPCLSCHPEVQMKSGFSVVQYTGVPQTCHGCHVDYHQGRLNEAP